MAGQGMPGTRVRPLGRTLGCHIFNEAIDAINQLSAQGVYGINVSLRNSKFRHPLREAVERLFQRFENNLGHVRQHGLVIYDGSEAQSRTMARHILRRMQVFNLIPSMLYPGTSRAMPVERILGDPAIRNASDDVFLQMADLMAYALLRKDRPPTHPELIAHGIKDAFDRLGKIFLTVAHRPDPQGVVRA